MFKKSKKNCQGTINSEHKCGQNDVCCMPGALETLMQRLLKSFPGVLEILLQSIKDNQNTMKDALSELKSNITDLSSNTEIKLNKSQAMMESNQNVLMSNLTNLKNNQDVVMGNLTNLKNNQDVVMSNLTNLGSTHCPKGFFMSTGPSRQCFKQFRDTYRNWASAVSKCQAEGLVLAEPYDPVTVRSYLVQRYGGSRWTWINGRGTGSYVTLQRSGAYVYSGNSYWYSGQPGSRTSSSYCLILMTSYANMKSYPNNTYYTYSCSSASFFTLCELIIE
ncbi:unnamed protein product [Meganyctiphanes norvegica]|uniref:C-type lectin domain-containing protein n=1 Tax=Meganyctiphanes norvegica TaxID=48144 RepID=A0AAV2QLR1_MEGNR